MCVIPAKAGISFGLSDLLNVIPAFARMTRQQGPVVQSPTSRLSPVPALSSAARWGATKLCLSVAAPLVVWLVVWPVVWPVVWLVV